MKHKQYWQGRDFNLNVYKIQKWKNCNYILFKIIKENSTKVGFYLEVSQKATLSKL